MGTLPTALYDLAAFSRGGKLWIIGGNNGYTDRSEIYAAPFLDDGSIGAWTPKTSYPLGISQHTVCATSIGFIVIGGSNQGTGQQNVYSGVLDENDAILKWTFNSLNQPSYSHSSTLYNERIINLGGRNNSAPVNTSGIIALQKHQSWMTSTSGPNRKGSTYASGFKNFVYSSGGMAEAANKSDGIYHTTLRSGGGFANWYACGYLPVSTACHEMILAQGRMYIFGGGWTAEGTTNAAWVSQSIMDDGKIAGWTRATDLPVPMDCAQAVAINERIYLFEKNGPVYSAKIQPDGLLEAWYQMATLPDKPMGLEPVVNGNMIYTFLRSTPNRVIYAEIQANNELGPWQDGLSLPSECNSAGFFFGAAFMADGKLIVSTYGKTWQGILNLNGSIDRWERLDDGANAGCGLGGIEYTQAWNVYGDLSLPATHYFPSKYVSMITTPVLDLGETRMIKGLRWTEDYPNQSSDRLKYRIFTTTWGAWQTAMGQDDAVVNQAGRYIQMSFAVNTLRQLSGDVSQIQIEYEPFNPTPEAGARSKAFLKTYHNQINPLHGEKVTIRWSQPQTGPAALRIYNLMGNCVRTLIDKQDFQAEQVNEIFWDGLDDSRKTVGSGIYLVHVKAVGFERQAKMAVVK